MKVPFQPLPDGEELMTIPQFLARLKHDPGFAEKMEAHYQAQLALPRNAETEEMHQAATKALRTLRHHQGAWKAVSVLRQGEALIEQPGFREDREAMQRALALTEEGIDHLLDVLEPERTRLLASLTECQSTLRAWLEEA